MRFRSVVFVVFVFGCVSGKQALSEECDASCKIPGFIEPEQSPIPKSPCPSDMVEVEGDFCPNAEEICLKWRDPNNKGANGPAQCEEFKYPTRCLSSKRIHIHSCIDKFEFPNKEGELPQAQMTFFSAKAACESQGKRLLDSDEWTLACEGNDIKPYPYGDGYHRDSSICNIDKKQTGNPETSPFSILDQRTPSGAFKNCKSDFGVYDIVGNTDELVYNKTGHWDKDPYVSGLKGGHWVKGARNRCRPMTTAHGPHFSYYVTSTRCAFSL